MVGRAHLKDDERAIEARHDAALAHVPDVQIQAVRKAGTAADWATCVRFLEHTPRDVGVLLDRLSIARDAHAILARQVVEALHRAGVETAEGIVDAIDRLAARHAEARAQMKLADEWASEIARALGRDPTNPDSYDDVDEEIRRLRELAQPWPRRGADGAGSYLSDDECERIRQLRFMAEKGLLPDWLGKDPAGPMGDRLAQARRDLEAATNDAVAGSAERDQLREQLAALSKRARLTVEDELGDSHNDLSLERALLLASEGELLGEDRKPIEANIPALLGADIIVWKQPRHPFIYGGEDDGTECMECGRDLDAHADVGAPDVDEDPEPARGEA